jgi:hypothetical protein
MATGWAGVVIRCEQIEGSAADDDALLLRVQVSIGDRTPEIIGPLVARRSEAGRLVAEVLDRIFDTLAPDEAATRSSDS